MADKTGTGSTPNDGGADLDTATLFLIKAAMARAGMSQKDLAARLGLSKFQMSRTLRGERKLLGAELDRIREILAIPMDAHADLRTGVSDEALNARMQFAARLKKRRTSLGWDLNRVVLGVRMDVSDISALEDAAREPTVLELIMLSTTLGVSASWLVSGLNMAGDPSPTGGSSD